MVKRNSIEIVASKSPIRRGASGLRHVIVGGEIGTITRFSHRFDQESIIYRLRGREFGGTSKPYIGLLRLGMQIPDDHQQIVVRPYVAHRCTVKRSDPAGAAALSIELRRRHNEESYFCVRQTVSKRKTSDKPRYFFVRA